MSATPKLPGSPRALTTLIVIAAIVQFPISAIMILAGIMASGLSHDPFGWVLSLAGLAHLMCLVVLLASIGSLRSGERSVRVLTTICIVIILVICVWSLVLLAPTVDVYAPPGVALWLHVLLPLLPLLPPLAVLLLLWVGPSARTHFTAAGPRARTSPVMNGENHSVGATGTQKVGDDD